MYDSERFGLAMVDNDQLTLKMLTLLVRKTLPQVDVKWVVAAVGMQSLAACPPIPGLMCCWWTCRWRAWAVSRYYGGFVWRRPM